jgi:hypothetical protein
MSHFVVCVVTKTPGEAELSERLQPFHEYECTGVRDQYVIQVDETDEARATYERYTLSKLKAPDGSLHDSYSDAFYRDPTPEEIAKAGPLGLIGSGFGGGGLSYVSKDWGDGKGYRAKVKFEPEEWEKVEVPAKDHMTFLEFIDYYYKRDVVKVGEPTEDRDSGFVLVDDNNEVVKLVRFTNPNAKWDWWVIGGRYRGRLQLKEKVSGEVLEGRLGVPELMRVREGEKPEEVPGVDQALKADIDFESVRQTKVRERLDGLAEACKEIRKKKPELSDQDIYAAWAEYAPLVVSLRARWEAENRPGRLWDWMRKQDERFTELSEKCSAIGDDWFGPGAPFEETDPVAWAKKAPPLSAYGFLGLDGQWINNGDMGWFGIGGDDEPQAVWEDRFWQLVQQVPDDCYLTFVDCHI